jgi:hypothetical protein
MSIRAYKWSIAVLLGIALLLAWQSFTSHRQIVTAAFIDFQCETTQKMFIEQQLDPAVLAQRLEFLMGYYEGYSRTLKGSPIAKVTERGYHQTLTNAVLAFRQWSTNDLGADPRAWIQKYRH